MGFTITAAAAWATAQFITITGITSLVAAQAVFAATVLAVATGIYELGQALAPAGPTPAAQKQMIRQAVGPRLRYYGEVKIGGTYAFLDDKNSFLYQLVMMNSGEIDSFVSHWLADVQVTVDGSGNVTAPETYFQGGTSYALIDTVPGTATQAAFPRLVAAFPGEWTSAHQLKGIACALVTLLSPPAKSFNLVFPGGLPNYNAVIHASKLWDPRDPAQDPDDPSTWTYL